VLGDLDQRARCLGLDHPPTGEQTGRLAEASTDAARAMSARLPDGRPPRVVLPRIGRVRTRRVRLGGPGRGRSGRDRGDPSSIVLNAWWRIVGNCSRRPGLPPALHDRRGHRWEVVAVRPVDLLEDSAVLHVGVHPPAISSSGIESAYAVVRPVRVLVAPGPSELMTTAICRWPGSTRRPCGLPPARACGKHVISSR